MKFFNIIIFFLSICSCNHLLVSPIAENHLSYIEDSLNQKIFCFGNIKSNNNVLVVIGSDIFKSRILSVGDGAMVSKVLDYIINPRLYYYYANDLKSDVFDKKFVSNEYINWKENHLDLENAYYYVIVTNKEENIFPSILSSGLVFNYFMFYFHGNRDYIESRSAARFISRGDLLINLNDYEIKSHFSKNCLSLILSCNISGFDITNCSFATLFSYYLGIKNMIVSNSVVFDNISYKNRIYYGNFIKVSYNNCDLKTIYDQYQKLFLKKISNSYRQEHFVINLPNSSILSNNFCNSINSSFNLVYSSYDDYYGSLSGTKSYCEIYLNYSTKEIIWKYIVKLNNVEISTICYKLSSEYFDLISFICDIHGINSINYEYLDINFFNSEELYG